MDHALKRAREHFDVFGAQLLDRFGAELDQCSSAWEKQVQELRAENDRLRSELHRLASSPNEDGKFSRQTTPATPSSNLPVMRHHSTLHSRATRHSGGSVHSAASNFSAMSAISKLTGFLPNAWRKTTTLKNGLFRLNEAFKEIDVQGTGVVKFVDFQAKLRQLAGGPDCSWIEDIPTLIEDVRRLKTVLFFGLEDDELDYDVFKHLMLGSDLQRLGADSVSTLNHLRSVFVLEAAICAISGATAVSREDMNLQKSLNNRECVLWCLEPATAVVIIINAAIIGLSLDIESESKYWAIAESFCTAYFLFEFFAKLLLFGPTDYFAGADWNWNLFDFVLACFAVTDLALSVYWTATTEAPMLVTFRDVTVLRVVRLLRIARLAKIFRLRYMKELALLASGIISGLRTLFWSFVLLFIFVYLWGLLLRQYISKWKSRTPCNDVGFHCNSHEVVLYDNFETLFADLYRTCFTVFRCTTGDCNTACGLPLAPILLETQGRFMVLCFSASLLFVIICVFNLIMAVFVENTMECARQDQQKLQQNRQQESVFQAQKMQQLVDRIVLRAKSRPSRRNSNDSLWRYLPGKGFLCSQETADSIGSGMELVLPTPCKITREIFAAAVADDEADEILECLQISLNNKAKLFDVLDSNGNGELDIYEIVDGLNRLRGPADKGDVVSNGLMLRNMQKNVTDMKHIIDQLHLKASQTTGGYESERRESKGRATGGSHAFDEIHAPASHAVNGYASEKRHSKGSPKLADPQPQPTRWSM